MSPLETIISQHKNIIHPAVPFNSNTDSLLLLDFTEGNKDLIPETINDTALFEQYINKKLDAAGALYGIGGYNEHRTLYARSNVFNTSDEPRRLHLGIDIWGKEGTPVFAPLNGHVHSLGNNNSYGDYGGTMILQHQLDGYIFHTLYGHLSLQSVKSLKPQQKIDAGSQIASFGSPAENGQWPPHLHMQLIIDMQAYLGDYPGVCKLSEREKYLANCPNPDLLINMISKAKP